MNADLDRILRSLAGLFIDYLRWSQLVPMLVAWSFLLLALFSLALVNFQEQGFTVVELLTTLWERYAWLPRLDEAVVSQPDGSMILDGDGFKRVVVSGWAGISLVLLVLGWVVRFALGPAQPRSFRWKLLWPLLGALVVWAALLAVYLFGSETFHGGAATWVLMFTGACAAAFVVSVYSLGVGHVLGQMRQTIEAGSDGVAPVDVVRSGPGSSR
jgi:hypothetical protein